MGIGKTTTVNGQCGRANETLQLVVIVSYKTQLRKWSTVGEIEHTWGEK